MFSHAARAGRPKTGCVSGEVTVKLWKAIPADQRLGLSYATLEAIKPKSAVIASPIILDDGAAGVDWLNAPSSVCSRFRSHPCWTALGFTAMLIPTILADYGRG